MWGSTIIFALFLISAVVSNDLHLGSIEKGARKIYSEHKQANAALWKRKDQVVIGTLGQDVISAINIEDLREGKDGETFIESGGVGTSGVTIGLKSPSLLRGYDFQIDVYTYNPNARYQGKGTSDNYQVQNEQYAVKS